MDDVKAFEMDPQRMRRVGQPSVRKGICCQEVAELVVHRWLRRSYTQPYPGV
jgi:hypothetical protein